MEEKVYFNPGDVVRVDKLSSNKKKDLCPEMIVKGRDVENGEFKGIICYWFTMNHEYQEATFNTKDLVLV